MKKILFLLLISLVGFSQESIYKTPNFNIKYTISDVISNMDSTYKSLEKNHVNYAPIYVQDVGRYLQQAYDTYCNLGLADKVKTVYDTPAYPSGAGYKPKRDTVKIDVTIKMLKDDNGDLIDGMAYGNHIYINPNIPPERGMSAALCMQKTCTHELLHYITLSHYSLLAASEWWEKLDLGTKWYWEALAVQGDRLVYPTSTPYEVNYYCNEATVNLEAVIQNSWDDCNRDKYWYVAGGFLSYLIHERDGPKAKFADLLKKPANDKTSYTRTVLDTYVKEDLKSNGLGVEYANYIRWNFENKGFGKIDNDLLAVRGNSHSLVTRISETSKKEDTLQLNISYMAAKVFRFRTDLPDEKTLVIKNLSGDAPIFIHSYQCNIGKKTFIKKLEEVKSNDSLVIVLRDKQTWYDLLVANTSLNDAAEGKISYYEILNAEGKYEGKVDFADDNKAFKSRYTIQVSDLKVDIDNKNIAKGTLEFYMDYKNDGMIASSTDFKGIVKKDGKFELTGIVKETNFPKCDKDCCTYDKIKAGTPCFKFNKDLYWHFDGKLKVVGKVKSINGNIVVSRTPIKNKDKANLKFSISTK